MSEPRYIVGFLILIVLPCLLAFVLTVVFLAQRIELDNCAEKNDVYRCKLVTVPVKKEIK